MAKVLNDAVGIERGHMTTIHSYTNDQNLLDVFHKDLHRARAAAMSRFRPRPERPRRSASCYRSSRASSTGWRSACPRRTSSLVDLTFVPRRDTTVNEIKQAIKAAADGPLKSILAYHEEPLVSIDFNHSPVEQYGRHECDQGARGKAARVASWYDNEWGSRTRCATPRR